MNQIADLLGVDLETLRLSSAAVNDGGNASGRAQLLRPGPATQSPGESVQWYRFHFFKIAFGGGADDSTGAPALEFKKRIDRRIIVNSFDRFAQEPRDRQRRDVHPVDSRAKDSISC